MAAGGNVRPYIRIIVDDGIGTLIRNSGLAGLLGRNDILVKYNMAVSRHSEIGNIHYYGDVSGGYRRAVPGTGYVKFRHRFYRHTHHIYHGGLDHVLASGEDINISQAACPAVVGGWTSMK